MDGTDAAWPGQRRLRDDLGIGGWLLDHWTGQLEAVGALWVDRGAGRRSNRYTPLDPSISAPPTGAQTERSTPSRRGTSESNPTLVPCSSGAQERRSAPLAPRPLPGIIRENQKTKNTSLGEKCANGSLRPHNPIWDTLAELFYPSGIAPGQTKHVGALTRDFKSKGATPEEIRARAERYRREWPGHTCTPNALLEHWDTFAPKPRNPMMPEPLKGVDEP
jgi:hypothetical protein